MIILSAARQGRRALLDFPYRYQPRPYQREVFEATRDLPGYAIFWEQGTGKTKISVDTFAYNYQKRAINGLLATAPNGVHINWGSMADDHRGDPLGEVKKHIPSCLLPDLAIHVWSAARAGTKKAKEDFNRVLNHKGLAVLCMSYDALITDRGYDAAEKFMKTRPVLWAGDESRAFKAHNSQRTKCVTALAPLANMRRPLDGTPMANGPFEVFFPVHFADQKFWASQGFGGSTPIKQYNAFKSYFGEWTVGYAAGGRTFPNLVGYRHQPELKAMLAKISSRVIKDDVLLDLPPKLYVNRMYELSPEQRKDYIILEKELDEILSGGEEVSDALRIQNALTKLMRIRELCAGYIRQDGEVIHRYPNNPKLDMFKEMCEPASYQQIVWCEHYPEVDDVVAVLGKRCVTYDGRTGDDQCQANKEAFLRGDAEFIVATTSKMRKGHTFTNAKREHFFTTSHDLEKRMQAEDRAHRDGQKDVVTIDDYVAVDTVEIEIAACHRAKEHVQGFLLGDQRKSMREAIPVSI